MAFLRVDGTAEEQQLIQELIAVAREVVEHFTGRVFLSQTWKLTMDKWPSSDWRWAGPEVSYSCDTIPLERTPLISVQSVKYYPANGGAQATLSSSAYHVLTGPQPGVVVLKSTETWPDIFDRPDAVEVNFTCGYASAAAVPARMKHALRQTLLHAYDNRGAINIGNIVNELPFSLKSHLEGLRVGGYVA